MFSQKRVCLYEASPLCAVHKWRASAHGWNCYHWAHNQHCYICKHNLFPFSALMAGCVGPHAVKQSFLPEVVILGSGVVLYWHRPIFSPFVLLFSSGVILFDNAKLRRIVCAHNFFNSFLSNNAVSLTDIKETVVFLPFVQRGDLDEGWRVIWEKGWRRAAERLL